MTGWRIPMFNRQIHRLIQGLVPFSKPVTNVRFGGPYPLLLCLRCVGGLNVTPRYYQPNEGSKGLTYNKIPPGSTLATGLAGQGSNCVFCRFSNQERQRYMGGCGNTTKEMQRFFRNGGGGLERKPI